MRKGQIKMNKYLKTSLIITLFNFVLAACGQSNSAGSATQGQLKAAETTQANT